MVWEDGWGDPASYLIVCAMLGAHKKPPALGRGLHPTLSTYDLIVAFAAARVYVPFAVVEFIPLLVRPPLGFVVFGLAGGLCDGPGIFLFFLFERRQFQGGR